MLNELSFYPNLCQNFIEKHDLFMVDEEGTKAMGIVKGKRLRNESNL